MEIAKVKKDLISELVKTGRNGSFSISGQIFNEEWESMKKDVRRKLNKYGSDRMIYEIQAYIFLGLLGIVAFLKIMELANGLDLNKMGLPIFFTVTNSLSVIVQKPRLARLQHQLFLLNLLERIDGSNKI